MLVAGDALELGGSVGFNAGFAAESFGENDGALVGDHVNGFGGSLAHPDGTGEHADADQNERDAEEGKEFEGSGRWIAPCAPAGGGDPEEGEGSPENAEDDEGPTGAAEARGDGLGGPDDAFAGTELHFDFVTEGGGDGCEIGVVHSGSEF